jgi:hypothetical protein
VTHFKVAYVITRVARRLLPHSKRTVLSRRSNGRSEVTRAPDPISDISPIRMSGLPRTRCSFPSNTPRDARQHGCDSQGIQGGKSHARMRAHLFELMCQPAPTPTQGTIILICMYRTGAVRATHRTLVQLFRSQKTLRDDICRFLPGLFRSYSPVSLPSCRSASLTVVCKKERR